MRYKRIIICLTLISVLVIGYCSTALAAPILDWRTTAVFYDGDQLIIRGYFINYGTRTIDRVNSINLKVFFRQNGTDWWLASSATWYNLDVYLEPGESSGYYNLRINNPNHYRFDYWTVNGSVNYHFTD